jgi:peptidoglycan/xylan/chitin deacetylase (PgdA/CDA1 family)
MGPFFSSPARGISFSVSYVLYKGAMKPTRRFRLARTGLIFAMALSIPLAIGTHLRDLAPPIGVRVNAQVHYLPVSTTLADVVTRFHLSPSSGDLKDISGQVLRAGAFPGRILLNGHGIVGNPGLLDGDTVEAQDGRDRTERTVQEVVRIPSGQVGNPQFFLGTQPGDQVITRGELSGKIASSFFRPSGPAVQPREVALTFDDGPSPFTGRILSILERFDAPATFFVIGFMAEDHPDLVRAEARAGMVIGNHSWDHPNSIPFRNLSPQQGRTEIGRTAQLLTSLGVTTSLFRPPGGSYSQQVIEAARRYDSRLVLWNVDPRDWQRGHTPAQITANVLANAGPGSIVELHDGGPNSAATVAALPGIIKGLRSKGLTLVAIQP